MSNDPLLDADSFPTRISNWAHLAALVEFFSYFNGRDWLFRGVIDSEHGLIPKIGRPKARAIKNGARLLYSDDDEESIIAMFKQQAMPYLATPPQTEIEWLAIAQHHGLPTRMLDWTDSLLVAAFFAVEKNSEDNRDGAIWVTREISAVRTAHYNKPLKIGTPSSYRPPHINARIGAQGSVLVVCPHPTNALAPKFTKRIIVDHDAKFTIKKRLNACGVNRRALFPDLGGLCDHLAWMYRHDWLSGYRKEPPSLLAYYGAVGADTNERPCEPVLEDKFDDDE
jgi:hypothetical protein